MPSPEVDDQRWPFVVSVIPAIPTEAFFVSFFDTLGQLLMRGEPWVHLIDTRGAGRLPDARARALITERTKLLHPLSARLNVGTAVMIDRTVVRGILTALNWLAPPPHPISTVGTPEAAVEYLRGCLHKADLPVPLGMHAQHVEAVYRRVFAGHAPR